jgi:hypothetical protein
MPTCGVQRQASSNRPDQHRYGDEPASLAQPPGHHHRASSTEPRGILAVSEAVGRPDPFVVRMIPRLAAGDLPWPDLDAWFVAERGANP